MFKQQQALLARKVSKALGNNGVEVEITFEKKHHHGESVAAPAPKLAASGKPVVEVKTKAKIASDGKVEAEADDAALRNYLCRSPWRPEGVLIIKIEGLPHAMAVFNWRELEDVIERGCRKAHAILTKERELDGLFSDVEPRFTWFDGTGLTIDPIGTLNYNGRVNLQNKLQTGQWFTAVDTLIADIDSVWNCPACAQEERHYSCRLHSDHRSNIHINSTRHYDFTLPRVSLRSRSRSPIDGQPSRRHSPDRAQRVDRDCRAVRDAHRARRSPSPTYSSTTPSSDPSKPSYGPTAPTIPYTPSSPSYVPTAPSSYQLSPFPTRGRSMDRYDRYVPLSPSYSSTSPPPRVVPPPASAKPTVTKLASKRQQLKKQSSSSSGSSSSSNLRTSSTVIVDRAAVSSGALGKLSSYSDEDED